MDVGSGFGFFPFWLSSKGHNVTCTDILKLDELYCEGKVRFLKNDITRNALDEKYDVIYSISVIEHIENKDTAINNMLKMLKTGGKLILTMDVDLSLKTEGTTPNYGEIAKLIHLLNGKLGKSLEEFSFDRRDLVTVSMYQHEKWRLPWRDPLLFGGLKDLISFMLSKKICKEQIPEIGVFCGIWRLFNLFWINGSWQKRLTAENAEDRRGL